MKSTSSLIGYILVFGFIYVAIVKGTNNPALFYNVHGLGIVFGGIIVAALASFPGSLLTETIQAIFYNMRVKSKVSSDTAKEIVKMAESYKKGLTSLQRDLESFESPFLKEAGNLVLEGIHKNILIEILTKRIDNERASTISKMNVLLTLGKYSPALGLAATVLGLVDMLGQLQSADMSVLGLGMAVALSGTFYGIILSNLVFTPLSELVSTGGELSIKEHEMVLEGVTSMLSGHDPLVVGEFVNTYLSTSDRIDFTESVGSSKEARV